MAAATTTNTSNFSSNNSNNTTTTKSITKTSPTPQTKTTTTITTISVSSFINKNGFKEFRKTFWKRMFFFSVFIILINYNNFQKFQSWQKDEGIVHYSNSLSLYSSSSSLSLNVYENTTTYNDNDSKILDNVTKQQELKEEQTTEKNMNNNSNAAKVETAAAPTTNTTETTTETETAIIINTTNSSSSSSSFLSNISNGTIGNNNDNNNSNNNNNNNNHNNHDNNKQKKLIAIIHAGPHKTGSTALQSTIYWPKYWNILEQQDNFLLLPFDYDFLYCLIPNHYDSMLSSTTTASTTSSTTSTIRLHPNCYDYPQQLANETKRIIQQQAIMERKNVMLSNEELEYGSSRYNLTTLQRDIFPSTTFEVHVCIAYRRYYQRFVSSHGHLYRWNFNWNEWPTTNNNAKKKKKTHRIPPIIHWLTLQRIENDVKDRYSVQMYEMYNSYFPNTTYLINYHDKSIINNYYHKNNKNMNYTTTEEDIVINYACHEETHTPNFCAALLNDTYTKLLSSRDDKMSIITKDASSSNNGDDVAVTLNNNINNNNNNIGPTQRRTRRRRLEEFYDNRGATTIYDEILMAAYAKGMLPSNITNMIRRNDARKRTQAFIEKNILLIQEEEEEEEETNNGRRNGTTTTTMNSTEEENSMTTTTSTSSSSSVIASPVVSSSSSFLPMSCLNETIANRLLEISLQVEKRLFPDFFQSRHGETALRADFEMYKRTKLCSVDSDAVFEQYPNLVHFLTTQLVS